MDFIKDGINNLKSIGFGAAVPGLRDRLSEVLTGDQAASQASKIAALEADVAAGKKSKQQAEAESKGGMKKGGKVSSASKRADGCAIKGKTKGRMV